MFIALSILLTSPPQMHTGATTAGVVGSKMPRLDVFCTTVDFVLDFTIYEIGSYVQLIV